MGLKLTVWSGHCRRGSSMRYRLKGLMYPGSIVYHPGHKRAVEWSLQKITFGPTVLMKFQSRHSSVVDPTTRCPEQQLSAGKQPVIWSSAASRQSPSVTDTLPWSPIMPHLGSARAGCRTVRPDARRSPVPVAVNVSQNSIAYSTNAN